MILAGQICICVEEVIRFPREEVVENKDIIFALVVPSDIKRCTSLYDTTLVYYEASSKLCLGYIYWNNRE